MGVRRMLLRRFATVVVVIVLMGVRRMLLRHFATVVVVRRHIDMSVLMIVVGIFHAFHDFLFHRVHIIHHGDNGHVGGIQGCQSLIQPVLHGAAIADKDISMLNGADVSRGRLKGMAVHSSRNNHLQVHLVSGNLAHKIIIGEQRYRHFQLSVFFRRCIKSALTSASLRASPKNQGYTENRGCTSCF